MQQHRRSNGGVKLALLVLGTAAAVGGASYTIMSTRVEDQLKLYRAELTQIRVDMARDSGRIDKEETATRTMCDRLTRIEVSSENIENALVRIEKIVDKDYPRR